MTKRVCPTCEGSRTMQYKDYGNIVEDDCTTCDGSGNIEGCICFAREPSECGCGGWADVDIDEWHGEE